MTKMIFDAKLNVVLMLNLIVMGIFHIHIDTKTESPEIHSAAKDIGFYEHNFSGHPAGYVHFEPTRHSSIKISDRMEFQKKWKALQTLMRSDKNVAGYIEGEYIPTDVPIAPKEVTQFKLPEFNIVRRRLSAALGEKFRETELHVVMDFDKSDQRVITGLLDAGLYGALLNKQDHRAIILTAQGSNKIIKPLIQEIRSYLEHVGGVVHGSIKEERALLYELYNMEVEALPEVVDKII